MPVIKIDYDNKKFNEVTVAKLVKELQHVTAGASQLGIEDVSVYANANEIAVNAAPMEVYIQVGSASIPGGDMEKMLDTIAQRLRKFKDSNNISIPINISVVQMTWKFKLGI
ncbi:MAG: hypothetical protein G01um101429_1067 [Parcubacteria group bacterium Gr01-1014_29]|nr:MAG: hypothetical protein G01um101429_1067 [Parcubacteria group bacterium Gr01-1014_29]